MFSVLVAVSVMLTRNVALSWTPEGKRRGEQPRETWRRTVCKEREEIGWDSGAKQSTS